ncbi:MAG: GntR family transcriptional regulator [Planctomycetota bacterium]|nr:MAG: GntR family transcriptional regulator [Planctomycetota bacterium]
MQTPLHLTISPGADAPIYRQIVRQVREAIAGRRLGPGDRLQSQRQLAQQLVVSPLTVKKAYDELERDGLIRTARGQGTFVAHDLPTPSRDANLDGLRPIVRQLVHEARLSGVPPKALSALLAEEQTRIAAHRGDDPTETETS